ncbi:ubiquitin carboxyl-terminal hydrolase MINDY-3 homolog isoform X2 [Tribolium castaneum]|uniref:ubiquitin carboxyl-terminal hydrolase MINDY-3 homolog isoform X2 n=1 Tax=Tribolium castaneum TaxID=7070 RepID=UPI0001C0C804|nr:PREDICTED: protein FAM188A homolog isoform X2 [Tribolium castaneum]|eukprot:XP_008194678.1 PREDICTED: protein FAM188A homolog isoform X2 [Tribolium castaneum]
MAETSPSVHQRDLSNIKRLLWSTDIKADIFRRWSQGFYFSASEPTALEQAEGGPCAIIAPVQAFILKNLLLKYKDLSFREMAVTSDMQTHLLVNALCEILEQCTGRKYFLVYLSDTISDQVVQNGVVSQQHTESESTVFHEGLRIHVFQGVEEGLEEVQSDNSNDTSEPLIDDTYGYGSQSLINLMITGRATTYVWDHEQDVGGLKLKGLEKQSQIGFITIMEHLRYCTVGSFYKNPIHPVWVLGSDTHLTVLFSTERRLVSPETKTDQAKRVFKHFDPDGNNFISSSLLQDVLQALDLVSEEEYVEVMRKKLDPENLGIILLNSFMDEFFPKEDNPMPDVFSLVHYNSLAQSNLDGQIRYRIGECVLLESDLRAVSESNPMLTVLQTKWPNIEVRWNELGTPSLN